MRKILSLMMAVLFAGSLMAMDIAVPATTLDLQTPTMVTSADWYSAKAYYLDDDVLVVSGYDSYKSVAKQTWITFVSTGSSGASWDASAPFKGSTYYTNELYATVQSSRYTAYLVTGCDSVWCYGYNNSATAKYLKMNIYDLTGSTATTISDATVTPKYSVSNEAAGKTSVVLKQALDETKTYLVVTTGAGANNSRVYEVAFFRHPAPAATTRTIYLNTGGSSLWGIDSPDFFAHSWADGVEATDVKLTADEGNYFKAVVPIANDKVVFTRQKPGSTEIAWSGENFYNQTADLTIPSGKNCFTITGWTNGDGGKSGGEWSKYPTYYVAGTMTNWATGKVEMDENGSYKFEGLAAGKHEIKVIDNAGEWHGFDQLDKASSSVNVYGEGTGNVKFVMADAGDVTITYDGSKIVVKGTFVAPTTKFTVTVPAGTESAYIAGNFNNWTPAPMSLVTGESDKFSWTIDGDPVDTAEYKYLAGPDWKYVEVDADGNYLADNRTYAAADVVAKWLAVPVVNKYAKVKAAPVNWTGHYIISWADLKPHTAISGSNFVAAADAAAFADEDTISVLEGSDVDIRFSETAGAYTIKLPNGKYIKLPSSNAVSEDETAMPLYLGYFKGSNQEGVQIADKADLTSTSARMIYRNGTNERSYTNKINSADYKLPTLYRLVDEAFDCQDGPYAIRVNGTDIVETKQIEDFVDGEDTYKQLVAYLSLTKNDYIEVVNTSCGVAWLPEIQDAGLASHFTVAGNKATIDTTGCFDLYFKMLYGKDKLYIGPGICPEDTVRFYITGDSALVVDAGLDKAKAWDPAAVKVTEDTYKLSLKAGVDYKLKLTLDGIWEGKVKGYDGLTTKPEGVSADGDDNICFRLATDGDVTVTFIATATDTTFTVAGDFYVEKIVLKDLKLVPGVWTEANAVLAAWAWGAEAPGAWAKFEGTGDTLTAQINEKADSVIFVRFQNDVEPTWNDEIIWNRAEDQKIADCGIFFVNSWDDFVSWCDASPFKTWFATGAGWAPDNESNLVYDKATGKATLNLVLGKEAQWQAQVKYLGPKAEDGKTYRVSVKLKSNKDVGGVTIKYQDNAEMLYDNAVALEADKELVYTRDNLAGVAGNGVLVLDFGFAAAGTVIEISDIVIEDYEPAYEIAGSWKEEGDVNWIRHALTVAADGKTATYEIELVAGDYEFKMVKGAKWLTKKNDGKPYGLHRDWPGVAGVIDEATENLQLTADVDGKYLFTWTFENDSIGITFPEKAPEPKFYITGNDALLGEKAWNPAAVPVMEDSYKFENLPAGDYKLKVTLNGTWDEGQVKGFDDLTDPKTEGLSTDNDKNICFTLAEAGDVTVTYTTAEFKVEGKFYVKPIEYITVYVILKNVDWAEVYAFVWDALGNHLQDWPGAILKELVNPAPARARLAQQEGKKVYSYEFPNFYDNIIFSNGTDEQTIDLKWDEAKPYFEIGGKNLDGKYEGEWKADILTDIENIVVSGEATKILNNGQIYILKNGKLFNVTGQLVK